MRPGPARGKDEMTTDDEKTIDQASGKEIVFDTPKDGQLIGTITAIGNGEGVSVIVEDDDKKTWVTLRKRDLKILLATLGPDPLDGRRRVLVRTDKYGSVQDVTVYADAVV
jgi:hypothetical protein